MASYRFNNTANLLARGTLDLLADSFYIALVTSLPSSAVALRSDIVGECSGGNYVRKDLTKTNSSPFLYLGNSSAVTFTNPVWANLWTATATPIVGGIILRGTVAGSAAGDNGAIIEAIVAAPVALSGLIPTTVLRVFKKGVNSNSLTLCLPEIQLVSISSTLVNDITALVSTQVPLLPTIQGVLGTKALLLGSGEAIYVALSTSVAPNGYNIIAQGGFY